MLASTRSCVSAAADEKTRYQATMKAVENSKCQKLKGPQSFSHFLKFCLSLSCRTCMPPSSKRKSQMDIAEWIYTESSCTSVWHWEPCQTIAAVQTRLWMRTLWISNNTSCGRSLHVHVVTTATRLTEDTHDSTLEWQSERDRKWLWLTCLMSL